MELYNIISKNLNNDILFYTNNIVESFNNNLNKKFIGFAKTMHNFKNALNDVINLYEMSDAYKEKRLSITRALAHYVNNQNEEHQIINSDEINTSTNNTLNNALNNNNSTELSNSIKSFESLSDELKLDEEKNIIKKNEWDDEDKIYDFLNDCHCKIFKKIQFTVEERKKIVELMLLNKEKFNIERISKLSGIPVKSLELWKSNHSQLFFDKELISSSSKTPTKITHQSIINKE